MRIVNSYGRHAGMLSIVLSGIFTVILLLLRFRWAHVWSVGIMFLALVCFCLGMTRKVNRIQAAVDGFMLNDPLVKVERKFNGLTYNGKPLKYYRKVRLTHSPVPYADERKGILWVHPKHMNADENALKVWEDNGGILGEMTTPENAT